MTEVIELISAEASLQFFGRPPPGEWSRPSACAGWTVGDVVARNAGCPDVGEAIARARAGDFHQPRSRSAATASGRTWLRGYSSARHRFPPGDGKAALLQAFVSDYQRLHQVLLTLQPDDWNKPCFHRRGVLPIRDYVGLRLQELAIHGWDIRTAFDDAAALSERPLPVLVGWRSGGCPTPSTLSTSRSTYPVSLRCPWSCSSTAGCAGEPG